MFGNDAWRAVAELAASQHGVITRSQAADNRLDDRELGYGLRSGLVDEPAHGVIRFVGAPNNWLQRLSIATRAGGGTVASHRSAARLHCLDGSEAAPIEVLTKRGRYERVDGVIAHRWSDLDPRDVTTVDGITCTSVAATLAQLGAVISGDRLDAALESALRGGVSEKWIRQTVSRLDRPGPSGTRALLRLLDDPNRGRGVTASELERLAKRLVLAHRLPQPQLQHVVVVADGRRYRLDLAWPEVMLGLEGHSRRYHFGMKKEAADHERDLALSAVGWDIQYVTRWQLAEPKRFVMDLAAVYWHRRNLIAA